MWRSSSKLPSLAERPAEETFAKRGKSDFILRRPIGRKGTAAYVYERNSFKAHLIRSCDRNQWTVPRCRLVDIARESQFFVATQFVFSDGDEVHVGSKIADMCLADIISGTMLMTEDHVSAILTQVIQGLYEITLSGIKYNNLDASKIFVSKEGVVQLANFGTGLKPQYLHDSTKNSDCIAIFYLANHILSKTSHRLQESGTSRQKKIKMKIDGEVVYLDPQLSSELLEFYQACDNNDISQLLTHRFLGTSGACLTPLVYHAIRAADLI